jgi:hypothetical protein
MTKYKIEFSETQCYSIEIEAPTEEIAIGTVECENVDEKRFIRHGCTNVYHIEVIDGSNP